MANMTIPGQSHARKTGVGLVYNDRSILLGATYPDQEVITTFDAVTGWTVLGNDTLNLAAQTNHCIGTGSLQFDKVNGAANTKLAGIQKTITSLDLSRFGPDDEIQGSFIVTSKAAVDYAFVRLGTDGSNYNEWQFDDAGITINIWQDFHVAISSTVVAVTGTGWVPTAVAYVLVGVAFTLETDALAAIVWNNLRIVSSRHTRT